MKHGISIPERDANEMLSFLNTPRDDVAQEPPAWGEWNTASDETESSESSAESSVSSDDDNDDRYQPFLQLPANPDGRRCRCGSTTHMTINSFACPLNPRNITENVDNTVDGATVGRDDDADVNNDDDDDDADVNNDEDDDDDANDSSDNPPDLDSADGGDDGVEKGDDANDKGNNTPDLDSAHPPPRRRRRLGLPTRRLRRINAGATLVANESIDVGTKVKSPGTRWNQPATTIYEGVVVRKSMFRGAVRFEVKWQDGVVEWLRKQHILPLLC